MYYVIYMCVLYVCMCVCVCSLTFCLKFVIILKKTSLVLKKIWRLPDVPELHMDGLTLESYDVLPLWTLDQHWSSYRQVPRAGFNRPRSPEISMFYTIIMQWEFDHLGLLECCVDSSSISSYNYSTSIASYGSDSVLCTLRTYNKAKGQGFSLTMYIPDVHQAEEVNTS